MAEPYMGEIRLMSYQKVPSGWAVCDGQLLPIKQYAALYSILGTQYGGDGVSTFALPNLQGRVPIHAGQGQGLSTYTVGQNGGNATVVLTADQMGPHTHGVKMPVNTGEGGNTDPTNGYLADSGSSQYASTPTQDVYSGPMTTTTVGNGQGHPNLQPSLCLGFVISLNGYYPSHN